MVDQLRNPEFHTCDCGYTWRHGLSGSHVCGPHYRKRIVELESQLQAATSQARDSALEEAAQLCNDLAEGENVTKSARRMALHCAGMIRLKTSPAPDMSHPTTQPENVSQESGNGDMAAPEQRQVAQQCKAVAHMAQAIATVHTELMPLFESGHGDKLLQIVGERTARLMELLGDTLNEMDSVTSEDEWMEPVFERAQELWPQDEPASPAQEARKTGSDVTSYADNIVSTYSSQEAPKTEELRAKTGEQEAPQASELPDWIKTSCGVPLPTAYARIIYAGWMAMSGIDYTFEDFLKKYKYKFVSMDSLKNCYHHKRGKPAIDAAIEQSRTAIASAGAGVPVAFLHDDPQRFDVIHAEAKALWLKFFPAQVEHYTIPLYAQHQAGRAK